MQLFKCMNRENISIKVNAKVNLRLDINGVFDDGYHDLDMLMASISLYDELYVEKSQNTEVFMDGVLQDEKNTAYKAAKLLEETFGYKVKVCIKKHIPLKAGLGGSSADAAGVFFAYGKLYGIDVDDMKKLALQIGSDVVYMLKGGSAFVKCRGEIVSKAEFVPLILVIAQKEYGGDTKDVYKEYDKQEKNIENPIQIDKIGKIYNVLQDPAIRLCPSIKETINHMKMFTKNVVMTGSGSAVIGIFEHENEAVGACVCLGNKYKFKKVVKTVPSGIEIVM